MLSSLVLAATNVSVVALSSYSRGFHSAINCWQSIVVCYLVPGPTPCPEVAAISYIEQAEVPTLFRVERDAQVKQKNHKRRFLTQLDHRPGPETILVATTLTGRDSIRLRVGRVPAP